MPSHLTRQVFRRLLANEPIVHRECSYRRAYHEVARTTIATSPGRRKDGSRTVAMQQRRSFLNFGMFRKPKREMKVANLDPGIEKMMELDKLMRLRARLPEREDIAKAFCDFFYAKKNDEQPIEDTQARLALQALEYCRPPAGVSHDDESKACLRLSALKLAVGQLWRLPKQPGLDHLRLAEALRTRLACHGGNADGKATIVLTRYFCALGNVARAREEVLAFEQRRGLVPTQQEEPAVTPLEDDVTGESSPGLSEESSSATYSNIRLLLWKQVLAGFVSQGDEPEIQATLSAIRERKLLASKYVCAIMIEHSIARADLHQVQHWWKEFYKRAMAPSMPQADIRAQALAGKVVKQALKWCLSSGNMDFGHQIVRDVMQASPPKPVWDAIFIWAVGTGKGVDEIGRMLDVMERSNDTVEDEGQWRRPDIATINALVEFAITKDDSYMAERFIALGRDRGIEPDAKTYVLQMEYRLGINDLDGALTAYKNLQELDIWSDEDVPTLNKLIVALCSSKRHDFDTIMNVAADLSDRRAHFEPLTVSTLSLLHLNRDEIRDVIDLLNTHAYHFSSTERSLTRDALVSYCLDTATGVSRSWDAYTIIRNVFDELPREPRTELMLNFFNRDRPDMAVHVFNHMRSHSRQDTVPTVDTYVSAFLGCAKRHDLESLEVVHNQLKLDYNINLNTYLRNALIIGYTACDRPRKALGFWDDIVASREGPTYNSIHIALRACERSPFGDLKAREIWEKLRRMDIELDSTLWASYVAALAGNGNIDDAAGALLEAEKRGELEVDAFVIGSLFEGTPGYEKQGQIEGFAKERYPQLWTDLERMGVEEGEDGARRFVGLDRSVTP